MAKKVKIKFTKSPTGLFKLSHHVNDVVGFPESQAKELVEGGVAVYDLPEKKSKDSESGLDDDSIEGSK